MKKGITAGLIIMVLMVFSACSFGNISEEKILDDINKYFVNEEFTVESVEVVRSRRIDKTDTIDVHITIKGDYYEGERWYTLIYNKYSRGGWQLDTCSPLDRNNWKATVNKSPDLSKETLAKYIFREEERGGYSLSGNIAKAKFVKWTTGAEPLKKGKGAESFIKDIRTETYDDGDRVIAEVDISAQSKVLKVEETINFEWYINKETFSWNEPYIYSMGTKVTARTDLNGTYLCKDTGKFVPIDDQPQTAEIKNFGDGDKFIYRGKEYVITGLFSACYDAGSSIKHNLTIGSDYIHESPYGWLIHLDDKIE